MSSLIQMDFAKRIRDGLGRASIQSADRWASEYRVMGNPYPGKWTFTHHPWLKRMHLLTEEETIGMKAAQMGFTDWAINVAFYFLDVERKDVLWVLPNSTTDASTFSSSRFDVALELSEHLNDMFSDTQNVKHKRAGTTNFFIRGSNSESGLKSVPVSLLVLDELEEMVQDHIPLARERVSGQLLRRILMISTPKTFGSGIHALYDLSTQDHYFFKCPACRRHIELTYPDNIVIVGEDETDTRIRESHLICDKCKATLHHEDKINFLALKNADWQSQFPGRLKRGYHISQMYAMNLPPYIIAEAHFRAKTDPAAEQELYNSKLGLPHIVKSFQLTEEMFNSCISNYRALQFDRKHFVTMGVDVGQNVLHVEIDGWEIGQHSGYDINTYSRCRMLGEFTVHEFNQLDTLMQAFGVRFCVIDCQPDKRSALEFANRYPGRVKLCRYTVGVNGRNMSVAPDSEHIIHVDRTSWLDLALGRFRTGTIELPSNVSTDYRKQVLAQIRVPKKDQNGNLVAKYETPGKLHDHFGHARTYAELALPFAVGMGQAENIVG